MTIYSASTSLQKRKIRDDNFKLLQIHETRLAEFRQVPSTPSELEYLLDTALIVEEYMRNPPRERKRELIAEYCHVTGINGPLRRKDHETHSCEKCGGALEENTREAYVVCVDCGVCSILLQDNSVRFASYDHIKNLNFKAHYTYERKSHFKDELEQCQGIEANSVPEKILDIVLVQCLKDKVSTMTGFKKQDMRAILKRVGLSAYYKHSVKIIQLLGGNAGLDLSQYEKVLYLMFQMIQEPFSENKHLLDQCRLKSVRQNFLNFRYTMRKFLEILKFERDDLNDYFPYIKNKKTLETYDEVWLNICKALQWEFIPSMHIAPVHREKIVT